MKQLTRITELLTNFTVYNTKRSFFQKQLIKFLKLYKIKILIPYQVIYFLLR
jgi:hypothetical protein